MELLSTSGLLLICFGLVLVFMLFLFLAFLSKEEEEHEVGWVGTLGGSGKSFATGAYRQRTRLSRTEFEI